MLREKTQKPLITLGTKLKISGHDAVVELIRPGKIVCRISPSTVVSLTFAEAEAALKRQLESEEENEDHGGQ